MTDCQRTTRKRIGMIVLSLLLLGCQEDPTQTAAVPQQPAGQAAAGVREPAKEATQIQSPLLDDRELTEGWIALFDGESLFGWMHENDADWRVEEGTIVVEKGEKGLLVTTTQFADYVLKVDFLCKPGTNSGIFLATGVDAGDVTKDCYELNIAGADNPFPTGSLVQRKAVSGDLNADGWQSYEVTVQDGHIVVHLDGKEVLDYTDPQPLDRGHIGLQLNEGRVAFRNIRLKPLGLQSIFNGRDLSGWKTYPDMPSKFTVTEEGFLNVKNGRGQLETEAVYGDFMLQLECISHAPGLNSGIFFRCIPGQQMDGYESQIHNGYQDGDRSRPVDCGTGGIFRRQNARRVVADDLQWFCKTIVADGPHMAVWVNGFQVLDWTDTRPPDANPRNGLRLEPGTIMIQGHDPTTNLSFRNLRATELPPRRTMETRE